MAKTKETIDPKEPEKKAKKLIEDIKKIIEDKLKDKTFSKNNPFIEESDQTNPNDSLPDPLKDFGKEEEKNWIFYGPPGTGKTFALNKIQILSLCINETKEERNILNEFWRGKARNKKIGEREDLPCLRRKVSGSYLKKHHSELTLTLWRECALK